MGAIWETFEALGAISTVAPRTPKVPAARTLVAMALAMIQMVEATEVASSKFVSARIATAAQAGIVETSRAVIRAR
jgi:hypothetical protein